MRTEPTHTYKHCRENPDDFQGFYSTEHGPDWWENYQVAMAHDTTYGDDLTLVGPSCLSDFVALAKTGDRLVIKRKMVERQGS